MAIEHHCVEAPRAVEDSFVATLFARIESRITLPVFEGRRLREEGNVTGSLLWLIDMLRRDSTAAVHAARTDTEMLAELIGMPAEALRL